LPYKKTKMQKIRSYFNTDKIQSRILKDIRLAKKEIIVATAWFTDKKIFNAMLKKLEVSNVNLQVIIQNDPLNINEIGLNWKQFIDKGGLLYLFKGRNKMHNKFYIVDEKIVGTGSYNWTGNKNYENLIVVENHDKTISKFKENFREISKDLKAAKEVSLFSLKELEVMFKNSHNFENFSNERKNLAKNYIDKSKLKKAKKIIKTNTNPLCRNKVKLLKLKEEKEQNEKIFEKELNGNSDSKSKDFYTKAIKHYKKKKTIFSESFKGLNKKSIGGNNVLAQSSREKINNKTGVIRFANPTQLGFKEIINNSCLVNLIKSEKVEILDVYLTNNKIENSSYSVEFTLKNKTKKDIKFKVPKGQIFENTNVSIEEQNLAISETYRGLLSSKDQKIQLPAYCANEDFSPPGKNNGRITIFKIRDTKRWNNQNQLDTYLEEKSKMYNGK
ncbi:phospholipase D-like domain-containing protein, partial [Flavobacteriaceae bacterium]|nr:phospholipase D-like domain-containing protein [Flavobacteriaceae bacterium]